MTKPTIECNILKEVSNKSIKKFFLSIPVDVSKILFSSKGSMVQSDLT